MEEGKVNHEKSVLGELEGHGLSKKEKTTIELGYDMFGVKLKGE